MLKIAQGHEISTVEDDETNLPRDDIEIHEIDGTSSKASTSGSKKTTAYQSPEHVDPPPQVSTADNLSPHPHQPLASPAAPGDSLAPRPQPRPRLRTVATDPTAPHPSKPYNQSTGNPPLNSVAQNPTSSVPLKSVVTASPAVVTASPAVVTASPAIVTESPAVVTASPTIPVHDLEDSEPDTFDFDPVEDLFQTPGSSGSGLGIGLENSNSSGVEVYSLIPVQDQYHTDALSIFLEYAEHH